MEHVEIWGTDKYGIEHLVGFLLSMHFVRIYDFYCYFNYHAILQTWVWDNMFTYENKFSTSFLWGLDV